MALFKKSLKADKLYKIGIITGFHGLDGTLKITPYYKGLSFDEITDFFINKTLHITPKEIRIYKSHLYLKSQEISENRDILKGQEVFVKEANLEEIKAPLIEDVEGKEFISIIDNRPLGKLIEYDYFGAQLTYLLKYNEQELMIPAIRDIFIKEITETTVMVDDSIFR